MTTTPVRASRTQALVIRYFDGDVTALADVKAMDRRVWASAFLACQERGWIADTELFPYSVATDAGRMVC